MVDFSRDGIKPQQPRPLSWKAITEFVGAVTFKLRDELTLLAAGRENALKEEFGQYIAQEKHNLAVAFEERLQQMEAAHALQLAELRQSVRDGSIHS